MCGVQIIMLRNREIFCYTERIDQKMFVDKMFERATIRGIEDYLLFGLRPDEDDRSYEERLDEPYMRFEKAVEKYDKSKILDCCINATINMYKNDHIKMYKINST